MEKSFGEIAERILKFIPKKSYVAFLEESGGILHSSLSPESMETVKKLTRVFPVWDVGDFQLKKLAKTNLLVYKVSPRIILALESYEKEGVLIVAARRLEENYGDTFRSLESQLPAPRVEEAIEVSSEKSSPVLVQQSPETETVPSEVGKEEFQETSVEPASEEVEETVPVSFPILVDKKVLKKVKEPVVYAILQLCDGDHTIDDIAQELDISKARVMITTGDFGAKGAIRYVSGVRKIKKR